jgi:hypothetical protein
MIGGAHPENSRRREEAMPRRSLVQKKGAKLSDHDRPSLTGDPALRSGRMLARFR